MAAPVARRAPYKDFLQPALQRRFAGTTAILLGLAYLEALTLSNWNSWFWSWFPLGFVAVRTVAISLCILPIIVLRIAHAQMGTRTSNSTFYAMVDTIIGSPLTTIETILTYTLTAWMFSQTYLLSLPDEAGLHWISRATGRSRLNEHALFFTTNLILIGLLQALIHLAFDRSNMVLGTVKPRREGDNNLSTPPQHWSYKLGEHMPVLIIRSGMQAISVGVANYVVVYHFFRSPAWRWAMWFFRIGYRDLPKYRSPPGNGPWSVWMLVQTIWASFLLSLLWNFGDALFRMQLAREPFKNDQPLTTESQDPNGSLLNGLKSKKPKISAFAMWELAFIARDFGMRRQQIFDDIDRGDGTMWAQIYATCIDTIRGLERRLDEYANPPVPAPVPAAQTGPDPQQARVAQPPRNEDVQAPRRADRASLVVDTISKLVTSPGKTPAEEWTPGLKRRAVNVADRVMTQQQRDAIRFTAVRGWFQNMAIRVLSIPVIGPVFQRTFSRQLAKAVLGSPYADISVYVNAAYALSQLAVCSLNQDKFGNVQRDVSTIIRTFTTVIARLERFRDDFPTHWSDIGGNRQCPEISEVLIALKEGLNALITTFGEFSGDLRLSRTDMRLAREAAEFRGEEAARRQKKAVQPAMEQMP